MKPANIKGAIKDSEIYDGRSTTLRNLYFYAHTLCMNYVTFLLVGSSVWREQPLCFVQDQRQKREQKLTTNNFDEFHNHSPLLTMVTCINYIIFLYTFCGINIAGIVVIS